MNIIAIGHSLKVMGYGNYSLQEDLKTNIECYLTTHQPRMVWILPIPGFGLYVADECMRQQIPFILVQPFRGHDKVWPQEIRKWYGKLQRAAIKIVNSDRMVGYQDKYGLPDQFAQNKIMKATCYACHQIRPGDQLLTTKFPHRQEWVAKAVDMVFTQLTKTVRWEHVEMGVDKIQTDRIVVRTAQMYDYLPF